MESCEVIIIGAGPAGLSCARRLSESGKKVLLLEKNKIIGPKICAGGLTRNGLESLDLPENLLEYKLSEATVHTPLQHQTVKSSEPYVFTVDRKELGQWQLENLKKTGTIIRMGCTVTEVGDDHVIVNGSRKIGFKYLVGADGSSSLVRRFLGIKTRHLIMGIQYIVPEDKYDKLEMFFDPELFSLGYAWIFPHKGYASIGACCINTLMSAKKLRDGFDKWLKDRKIDVSKGRFEAFPINFDYQGYRFGNIFLVGDAAGFASAITGGGIGQAVVSGEEIARLIIDKDYKPEKLEELIEKKKFHEGLMNFFRKSGILARAEVEFFVFLLDKKFFSKLLAGSSL